ncbi:hypothetical protein [Actinomadura atramentaria]|uniref:hypothetical protein n=1 Tax=Actinomadura atramentaria TaxID=1990 RepID=UPI000399D319|nr:hypothetical protein [Actinomadura atramentaria]
MRALTRICLPAVAAGAAVGLLAGGASAAGTVVRDSAGPYSGNFQFQNLSPISVQATILGQTVTASCTSATLGGTLQSSGATTLTSASISGCSGATVEFQNLPYTAGTVAYDPQSPGHSAGLVFTDSALTVKVSLSGTTCYYGFGSSVHQLLIDLYNPDNASRPDASVAELQGALNSVTLQKKSGSGFLCPSTGVASGFGTIKGESAPGVFDDTLHVADS